MIVKKKKVITVSEISSNTPETELEVPMDNPDLQFTGHLGSPLLFLIALSLKHR